MSADHSSQIPLSDDPSRRGKNPHKPTTTSELKLCFYSSDALGLSTGWRSRREAPEQQQQPSWTRTGERKAPTNRQRPPTPGLCLHNSDLMPGLPTGRRSIQEAPRQKQQTRRTGTGGDKSPTSCDLRLGNFAWTQQRCQDCPLDDDQSKRLRGSNSKPGEPGLARTSPQPAATSDSGTLLGHSSDARTVHWTTINPRGSAAATANQANRDWRGQVPNQRRPLTLGLCLYSGDAKLGDLQSRLSQQKQPTIRNHSWTHTAVHLLPPPPPTRGSMGETRKGYERIQFWLVTLRGLPAPPYFFLRVPENSQRTKQARIVLDQMQHLNVWK